MSASLIVDIGGTGAGALTLGIGGPGSGVIYAASGAVIGASVDMLHVNTATQISIQGNAVFGSGLLRLQVQASDSDVSGNFTDPTSGLAQMPSWIQSGGILWLNSGSVGVPAGQCGTRGAFASGSAIQSGFMEYAFFQRPDRAGRYARVNVMSGDFFAGTLTVGLVAGLKTTGSGGGFVYSPSSGVVNV